MRLTMGRRWLAGVCCCMAQAAGAQEAAAWHPYAQARAWAAYDAVPVKQIDGDWTDYSPKSGRNVMLQRQRAEVGVERGDWRLGWEVRREATLTSDRETLDFVRRYKQRSKPSEASDYRLAARLERWSAQGPRLGRWFGRSDAGGPRLLLSGAVYTRASLRDTAVNGTVRYVPVDNYDFDVRRTEANSADRYPFMRQEPGGAGASVSMALAWQLAPAVAVDAHVDDVWSAMRWRNLPIRQDRLDSQVSSYDADGYINYRPLLSGSNRQETVRGKLGRSGGAAVQVDLGPALLGAGVERLAGITIPTLSLGRRFGWGALTARVESRFKTVGIGIESDHVSLALQSDSLHVGKAKALGVSLGLRY